MDNEILFDTVAALTEHQDLLRRNSQTRNAIQPKENGQNEKAEANLLAKSVVNLLIPKRFTDLPIPIKAAVAIVANSNPLGSDKYSIAHLRVTTEALEHAIETAAYDIMRDHLMNSPGETEPTYKFASLFKGRPSPGKVPPNILEFQEPSRENLLFLLNDGGECEAIWWLHTGDQSGWPSEARKYAEDIHRPMSRILQIAEQLTGWQEGPLDIDPNWRHTLPLFAEFKLRDNLAERYYRLVSRVLFAAGDTANSDSPAGRRLDEFRLIMRICLLTPWALAPEIDLEGLVRIACDSVIKLRGLLQFSIAQANDRFLGTTSFVRVRHRLTPEGIEADLDEGVKRLLPVLPLLRMQERLHPGGGTASVLSELGEHLELETLVDNNYVAKLGKVMIPMRVRDHFAGPVTSLYPDRADWWTDQIVRRIEETGTGGSTGRIQEELSDYLGAQFMPLAGSSDKDGDKLQAELQVVWQEVRAKSVIHLSYERKLAPIANLYRVSMHEQYRFGRALADTEVQRARVETAERLVEGTSHYLKIPIQVAKAYAEAGDASRAKEVLELATGFVVIGAYVKKFRSDLDAGKAAARPRLKWDAAKESLSPSYFSLTRPKIEELIQLSIKYVSVSRKDNSAESSARLLGDPLQGSGRRIITFGTNEHFHLLSDGIHVQKDETQSRLVEAALLELLANAVSNADPHDPTIIVDVIQRVTRGFEKYLAVSIYNSVKKRAPWPSRQDLDRDLARHSSALGIYTADWAIKSLGWNNLIPTEEKRESRVFQVLTFVAPLK